MRRLKAADVSTLIEALRALQRDPGHDQNEDVKLGDAEIDELCEDLNFSDVVLY